MRLTKKTISLSAFVFVVTFLPIRGHANETYILSAPPWSSWETGVSIFNPIAFHLSHESGEQVIYQHPTSWASYIENMRESKFDIVFDDAHLVSWRVKKLGHIPIVKLDYIPGYTIVTQVDNEHIIQLRDLAGHPVCSNIPPSLGASFLYTEFSNPIRQPKIVATAEDANAIDKLLNGECQGAVLSLQSYRNLNPDRVANTRVLFIGEDVPSQAFTVDPRIPIDVREIFRSALLSVQGIQASARLLQLFSDSNQMVSTDSSEYQNQSHLLRYYWGMD